MQECTFLAHNVAQVQFFTQKKFNMNILCGAIISFFLLFSKGQINLNISEKYFQIFQPFFRYNLSSNVEKVMFCHHESVKV